MISVYQLFLALRVGGHFASALILWSEQGSFIAHGLEAVFFRTVHSVHFC